MISRKILPIFLAFIILSPAYLYAQTPRSLYYKGRFLARSNDKNFAFFYFNRLARDFPDSKFAKESLFAVGEYYFVIRNYQDSASKFLEYINYYPESKVNLFSLMYLFKAAQTENNQEAAAEIEKKIFNFQQISLIFRDFKEYRYKTALDRELKAVYFIDKVEFYIDGQFFTKASY